MTLQAYMRGLLFGQRFSNDDKASVWPFGKSARKNIPPSPLEQYFDANTQGPGIWKWRHYFDIYHRHFAKFVGKEVHVLEIGVYSGGSLGLWKNYFGRNCHVYGIDIMEECRAYESDSVKIFIGDQSDRNFWKKVIAEVPRIDIVIDDGGHLTEQQIATFEELLPHISPGGVYMCEDVYGVFNAFHDYMAGMVHQLNALGEPKPGIADVHNGMTANPLQRSVHSVHLYPFVSVVEKNEAPTTEFTAPKKGTQWQPWL